VIKQLRKISFLVKVAQERQILLDKSPGISFFGVSEEMSARVVYRFEVPDCCFKHRKLNSDGRVVL